MALRANAAAPTALTSDKTDQIFELSSAMPEQYPSVWGSSAG